MTWGTHRDLLRIYEYMFIAFGFVMYIKKIVIEKISMGNEEPKIMVVIYFKKQRKKEMKKVKKER